MPGTRLFHVCILAALLLSACDNDPYCPKDLCWCWAKCIDCRNDNDNCGQCSNRCGLHSECVSGECACVEGYTDCGGQCVNLDHDVANCGLSCVDTDTDEEHCGECFNACGESQECIDGMCRCLPGLTYCYGICVDTNSDPENCGTCNNHCADADVCMGGICGPGCGDRTQCGAECADLSTSRKHCGACYNACRQDQLCRDGVCQCAPNEIECSGECTDLDYDDEHCGSCDSSCGEWLSCCQGSCTDTQIDEDNCGGCGIDCGEDGYCIAGTCGTTCNGIWCGTDGCVNPDANNSHCGECDNPCDVPNGFVCQSGECLCIPGLTECGDVCVNLRVDRENCGACGNSCGLGGECELDEQCEGGVCLEAEPVEDLTPCEDGNPDTLWDACFFGVCLGGGGLPDTGLRWCADESSEIVCPGIPGDPPCAATDWCGQDAQYGWDTEHDPSERFTVEDPGMNGEELVIDHITGLHWQRGDTAYLEWDEAVSCCEGLSYAGFDDWRLPSLFEMIDVADYGSVGPAVDSSVFNVSSNRFFWSSSQYAYSSGGAGWASGMHQFGGWQPNGKGIWGNVICVRGDETALDDPERFYEFKVNGEEMVADHVTGLLWQKTYATNKTRKEALAYCEGLIYGEYENWHLPNQKEVGSLISVERWGPASDFPGMPSEVFWSSTQLANSAGVAWGVDFYRGKSSLETIDSLYNVRCVRLGR